MQWESMCKNKKNRLLICLVVGMLIGCLIHLYMLTNKLPNWDDITCYWSYGAGETVGRWFLPYLKNFLGWMSVPALNGLVTIFCISVSSYLVIECLNIKSLKAILLTIVMMLSFPSVISQMTFMFTSSCYGIAIVFSCLAALLIRKKRIYVIVGIVLSVLSLAVYQAYFCLTAGILVLSLIVDLMNDNEFKTVLRHGIQSFISLLSAMGLYLLFTKFVLPYQLDDYKGVSSMGNINILQLPRLIGRAYKRSLEYFITNPYSYTSLPAHICNVVICVLIVLCIIYILRCYIKQQDWKRILFLFVLLLLFPLVLSAIYIMAPEIGKQSTLTLYQYVLMYILLIVLMENIKSKTNNPWIEKISVVVIVTIISIGCCNFSLANNAYYRMHLSYERVYAYYNRLVMSLENTGEYEYGEPVLVVGNFWPNPTPLSSMNLDDERYVDLEGVALENGLLTPGVRRNFIRVFLGYELPEISAEQEQKIISSQEYKDMEAYPKDNCIKKIDGIWIIKIAR